MSIKEVVLKQYQSIIDKAYAQVKDLHIPPEGWLRTARNALGMSGAQLAKRMQVTRANISKTELAEQSGAVSIKNMQQIAEAMECRFVYAVIPKDGSVGDILKNRAIKKAKEVVKKTDLQMALEAQSLTKEQLEFEVNRIAEDILKNDLSSLWDK